MPPLILNNNFTKRESKTGYPLDSIWDRLDWEPAGITTTLCSTTIGGVLSFHIAIGKVLV